MSKTLDQIENYIQLHTAEMDDAEYLDIMRNVASWANKQVEAYECREDNDIDNSFDE